LIGYTSDQFELPLPVGHRFPMAKYRLLRERISDSAAQLGVQLREAPWADDEAVLEARYLRIKTFAGICPLQRPA